MVHFTIKLMSAIKNKENIKELTNKKLIDAINLLLKHELTVFIDYEKWDVEAKGIG